MSSILKPDFRRLASVVYANDKDDGNVWILLKKPTMLVASLLGDAGDLMKLAGDYN